MYFGIGVSGARAGFGRHIYYLDIAQVIQAKRAIFILKLLSPIIICVVKISVALFLLRIGGLRRWLRVLLFTIIALLISSTTTNIIILLVQYRPIAGHWDPTVTVIANHLSPSALTDVTYCFIGLLPKPLEVLPTLIIVLYKPYLF